jgi:hypothetical protein
MIQIVYQVICLCKSLMINDCNNDAHNLHTIGHGFRCAGGLLLGCGSHDKRQGGRGSSND